MDCPPVLHGLADSTAPARSRVMSACAAVVVWRKDDVRAWAQQDEASDDRDAIEKARSTLEQALFLAQRVGNAEEQAAALINLGYVLSKLGETEAALQMDRDALVAFESVGIKAGVACVYCNLAEKLYGSGRWKESKAAALNGLAVAEEINNPYWITGGP